MPSYVYSIYSDECGDGNDPEHSVERMEQGLRFAASRGEEHEQGPVGRSRRVV